MSATPIKTFICYAHEDRDIVKNVLKYLQPLKKQKLLEIWDDGQILAGEDWYKVIKTHLDTAQLVLLFVSIHFINSDYIESTELKSALERHDSGESVIVPIIVMDCDWQGYFKIGRFQALPKQNRPILSNHFQLPDYAYNEIAIEVKALAQKLIKKQSENMEDVQLDSLLEDEKSPQLKKMLFNALALAKKYEVEENAHLDQLQKQDESSWQIASEQARQTANPNEKIAAFTKYLDNPGHKLYRIIAEHLIEHLSSVVTVETKSAEPQILKEVKVIDRSEMVFLKGGTFLMGDFVRDKLSKDEFVHTVTVGDFYISKHAVTFDDFDIFCKKTKRTKPYDEGWGRGKLPVINIDWYDAIEYCNWLSLKVGLPCCYEIDYEKNDPNNKSTEDGKAWVVRCNWQLDGYRLPTESEWEFAARVNGAEIKFGEWVRLGNGRSLLDPTEVNFDANSEHRKEFSISGEFRAQTVPVHELSSNEIGLKNMSGNVNEWCWDWYAENYYHESNLAKNPRGPASGCYRVLRGGSWGDRPEYCRVSARLKSDPIAKFNTCGFRLVRTSMEAK